jgi:hypothetical protein
VRLRAPRETNRHPPSPSPNRPKEVPAC